MPWFGNARLDLNCITFQNVFTVNTRVQYTHTE